MLCYKDLAHDYLLLKPSSSFTLWISWKIRHNCLLTAVVQLWPDYWCASLWIFYISSKIMTCRVASLKFRVASGRCWHRAPHFLITAELLLKKTQEPHKKPKPYLPTPSSNHPEQLLNRFLMFSQPSSN